MVTINLANYKVDGLDIDVKDELTKMLKVAGVYANGDQLCSGLDLADHICQLKEGSAKPSPSEIKLSDDEHNILKHVLNVLIAKATPPLGGPRYNELITRVFRAGK